MTTTVLADVTNQVQKFWSGMFMDELKEANILSTLVNKDYEGEIKQGGDTVYVSQINRPTGQRKTIGAPGYDTFNPSKLSTSRVAISASEVITASFEFDDIVQLQSQIGSQDSKIRQALLEAVGIELNTYLYSLIAPSAANPDHIINGVADFNAAQANTLRKLASQAKWKRDNWYLLLDPSYKSDFLNSTPVVSGDFVGGDLPVIGGEIASKRFGFNVLEDNSEGMKQLSPTLAAEDFGLAFHPDFLHLVMQKQPTFEIAPLISNKQFGYVIVVRMICGAGLGIDGAKKHIKIYNT